MQANNLKVLVLGYGSREHALAWKIAQSPRVAQIFVAPGNAGTASIATNVPISDEDIDSLVQFACMNQIDLTVVGTNDPVALGVVDAFQANGLPIFGPTQAAGQLESSKAFSKAFMRRHNIPTPAYATFHTYEEAVNYVNKMPTGRMVVKVSGLGKMGMGVTVCDTHDEAIDALQTYMLDNLLGESANTVIIEERIDGPELSVFGLSDGKTIVPLPAARDHKRIFDNDTGPNTGGMGAFGPPTDVDDALMAHIFETIMQPTIDGMATEGKPYVGVLFAGLMQTQCGIQVLEFNCRFGNPEALVLMMLLENDLVDVMESCIKGSLSHNDVHLRNGAAATIVISSPGYPAEHFPKGLSIRGVHAANAMQDVMVFHHGTAQKNGQLVTSRGRVLAVTAVSHTLEQAICKAYKGVDKINFPGAHFRRDIGTTPKKMAPTWQQAYPWNTMPMLTPIA